MKSFVKYTNKELKRFTKRMKFDEKYVDDALRGAIPASEAQIKSLKKYVHTAIIERVKKILKEVEKYQANVKNNFQPVRQALDVDKPLADKLDVRPATALKIFLKSLHPI